MFLLFAILCTSLKVEGFADYEAEAIAIGSFGFDAGGTLSIIAQTEDPSSIFEMRFNLFTEGQYMSWMYMSEMTYDRNCDAQDSIGTWRVDLNGSAQSYTFQVLEKHVGYAIVAHCFSYETGRYHVEAQFTNPSGLLDNRKSPTITLMYVDYVVFSVLIAGYIGSFFVQQKTTNFRAISGLLVIHFVIMSLPIIYIAYCAVYQAVLVWQNKSEETSKMEIVQNTVGFLYQAVLLATIMTASTGWKLLHVKVPLWRLVVGVVGSFVFSGLSLVQLFIDDFWFELMVLASQVAVLAGLMTVMLRNIGDAARQAKAHLLVIQQSGIDPRTTPVYEKYKLFQHFKYAGAGVFALILGMNLILTVLQDVFWIATLMDNVLQLMIIITLMVLFHPVSAPTMNYFRQRNEEHDVETRQEVDMMELEDFDPTNDVPNMRTWDSETTLPLEPVVVSNAARRDEGLLAFREANNYTAVPSDHPN